MFLNFLQVIRVRQWHKNILVFAPLFFSGRIVEAELLISVLKVFVLFCLAASVVYILNDVWDKEFDKQHPIKKLRPLAAGRVTSQQALGWGLGLVVVALVLAWSINIEVLSVITLYLVGNLFYSLSLKRIPVVDVLLVALMYILRILAGAYAVDLSVSVWILVCTFALALLLVFGKRISELAHVVNGESRTVIRVYGKQFLDHALILSATLAIGSYFLYTISTAKTYLVYSSLIVLFVILRYLFLIYHKVNCERPEELLIKDKQILLAILIWIGYMTMIYY